MHSTKKIVCSVFVVMVALGLGGYLGLADAALAERDLTDAEMAGITGKGPDPVVACDGCYLETIGALCNLVDPCMCVVGQNTPCSFDSRIYKGFSTVNRFRNPTSGENNNKVKYTGPIVCYELYKCWVGEMQLNTRCRNASGEDGTCGGTATSDCKPCESDYYYFAFKLGEGTIEQNYCKECPN